MCVSPPRNPARIPCAVCNSVPRAVCGAVQLAHAVRRGGNYPGDLRMEGYSPPTRPKGFLRRKMQLPKPPIHTSSLLAAGRRLLEHGVPPQLQRQPRRAARDGLGPCRPYRPTRPTRPPARQLNKHMRSLIWINDPAIRAQVMSRLRADVSPPAGKARH